jgi:hypothetical protein
MYYEYDCMCVNMCRPLCVCVCVRVNKYVCYVGTCTYVCVYASDILPMQVVFEVQVFGINNSGSKWHLRRNYDGLNSATAPPSFDPECRLSLRNLNIKIYKTIILLVKRNVEISGTEK